ncbi:MAG: TetR/AcrR family transcriptional regulator [Clostridia bacterium]|nr:TetR/AcrR family transcriptional regulator [Clostridia bacterium]
MKKTDARIRRTYSYLMNAMIELAKEKDFENLSVSEICDRAGVHRATFYKHFDDKLEFIRYCFETQLEGIEIDGIIKDPTPENLRAGIKYCVDEIFNYIDKNMELLEIICSEKYYMTLGSTFFSALNKFCYEKFNYAITAPGYQVEILSNFYSSALIGVIRLYVTGDKKINIKEDIYRFLEHRIDELVGFYSENMYNLQHFSS